MPAQPIFPTYLDLAIEEARVLAGLISEHCGEHDGRRRVRLARVDDALHVDIAGVTWVLPLAERTPSSDSGRDAVPA